MGFESIINMGKKVIDPFGVLERTVGGLAKDLGFGGNKGSETPQPQPLPLPQAPKPEDAAAAAEKSVQKRRAASTPTTFTDPLGVSGQADIVRKTLTGQ